MSVVVAYGNLAAGRSLMAHAATIAEPVDVTVEWRRIRVVLIPLVSLAGAVVAATLPTLGQFLREGRHLAVFVVLLGFAVAASAFQVRPTHGLGVLTFESVVVISAAVLYGAAIATIVAAAAELARNVIRRNRRMYGAYNVAGAVLAGAAAGAVANVLAGSDRPLAVLAVAGAASLAFYAVNASLTYIAFARTRSIPKFELLTTGVRAIGLPFVFVTSLVPLVVVAWRQSPLLVITAAGPFAAICLHQARVAQAAAATALARTDPLTGLGNRRHFDERLRRELDQAHRLGTPVSLCLLDLDDFKTINDTYGHAAGDDVLAATACCLRRDGEAFRYGGDEFALLLPGYSETAAREVSAAIWARIRDLRDPGGHMLAASTGTATSSPFTSDNPAELLRAADAALYRRKKKPRAEVTA
jgi:diguanylate cyclase (GGDEF)-like protein